MNKLLKCQLLAILFVGMSFSNLSAQIDPSPYLGAVTLNNLHGNAVLDWTIEAVGNNQVVLKNESGYVKQVVWNHNVYTDDKNAAFRFIMDNKDGGIVLKDANNPDMYYTAKRGDFGNIPMHPYMADGSTWAITSKMGIDPTPFLGNANLKNRTSIDWTIESAGGNQIVLKNGSGYVKQVNWNGNDYTSDKSQAMKFVIDNGNSANTLRSVEHPDSYYTHKGGNNVMHAYMHDGSNWAITKR